MREVEVKILEIDKDYVVNKLLSLGAEKIFDGRIESTYFETDDDKTLRVRRVNDDSELVLKLNNNGKNVKDMEEIHTLTSSFENTLRIFESLGFEKKSVRINKFRESYKIGDTRFEIDTIDGLPTLLEIEGNDEKGVMEWVDVLGYERREAKPWTGLQVLDYYKKV